LGEAHLAGPGQVEVGGRQLDGSPGGHRERL
jgi:hypothetical protein